MQSPSAAITTTTTTSAMLRKVVRNRPPVPRATTTMVVDNRTDNGSVVGDDDVRVMVAACNTFMEQLANAWGLPKPDVRFAATGWKPPAGAWLFHLIGEDANVPGALAYHTEEGGKVDGYVLTKTILDNGGVPLYDATNPLTTPTVASALFHELAEAMLDPTCNGWWMDSAGSFYAAEVCDPVQGNNVLIKVPELVGAKRVFPVALSDFVFPAWRDPQAAVSVRKNFCDTIRQPFALTHGGYYVKYDPSSGKGPQQVFGERVPGWIRDMKAKSRRVRCRIGPKARQ